MAISVALLGGAACGSVGTQTAADAGVDRSAAGGSGGGGGGTNTDAAATGGAPGTGGSGAGGSIPDAGGAPEAGTGGAAGACDLAKPFGTPTPVSELNSTGDDNSIFLSDDELTAYLSSDRPGGMGGDDIWVARRTAITLAFGAPALVEGINTAGNDIFPAISRDGLKFFFTSNGVTTGNDYDIVVASRTSTVAVFSAASSVAGINSASYDASAWFSPADSLVYFYSGRANGLGGADIWVADFGAGGASNARNLGALNTTTDEETPVVSADGLTIYFSSKRTAATPMTTYDIWMARRSTIADGFGQPVSVTELNTPTTDAPSWLTPDGCTLYFISGRAGGMGGFDIYQATRGR